MIKNIEKSNLVGEIKAISSKSYAHRLMICAFLTDKIVKLNKVTLSADILATYTALTALGGKIDIKGDSLTVNFKDKNSVLDIVDCGESGSTLRFMLPLVSALGVKASLTGSQRLLARPSKPLIECLNAHGADIQDFTVNGKLTSGEFIIDASVSSQYISGLLMALPMLDGDSVIILKGERVSKSYIDITLEILKLAGIKIDQTQKGFYVYGNQKYNLPSEITVNGDWSNSAFFLVAGGINNNCVTVSGLTEDAQGDRYILEILKKAGASVKVSGDRVSVKANEVYPISVDLTDAPDLAPVTSVLCALANGVSEIYGVDRLRDKESDRLQTIIEMLKCVGVKTEYNNNCLKIYGEGKISSGEFNGFNDHRLVMSESLLSSVAGGVITGAEAVNKSYPNYFEDYISIGGIIK